MRFIQRMLGATFASMSLSAHAGFIDFDVFNYTGSVTEHGSLSDAQNGTASGGPHVIPTATNGTRTTLENARDAGIVANSDTGAFTFYTAWYYTPQSQLPNVNGSGNPNNTNTGFVQLSDTDSSSVENLSITRDAAFQTFSVVASGSNAGASEFSRLWAAPTSGGSGNTAGVFIEYMLDLTVTFATPNGTDTRSGETPDSVSGGFTGIFQNTSDDTGEHGFYSFDFSFQSGSSAENGDYVAQFRDGNSFSATAARSFGAEASVPVPATFALLILGLSGLGWSRRSKKA